MKRFSALLAVLMLTGLYAAGIPLSELGFYSSPAKILSSLKGDASRPEEYFVLARAYRQGGDSAAAVGAFLRAGGYRGAAQYGTVVSAFSGIAARTEYFDDAVLETAEIEYGDRRYRTVTRLLDLIGKEDPYIRCEAMLLKSNALVFTGKSAEALDVLERLLEEGLYKSQLPGVYLKLAFVAGKRGDERKARNSYAKIVLEFPGDWEALTAALELFRISQKSPVDADAGNAAAGILARNGRFVESAALYLKYGAGSSAALCHLALVRSGRTAAADALISKTKVEERGRLLFQKAELLYRTDRDAALVLYARMEADSGQYAAEAGKRVLLDLYRRDTAGFIAKAEQYAAEYSASLHVNEVCWLLARLYLKEEPRKAVPYLERLTSSSDTEANRDRALFFLFLLGKGIERSGYQRRLIAEFPDSYYTVRSVQIAGIPASDGTDPLFTHYVESLTSYEVSGFKSRLSNLNAAIEIEKKIDSYRKRIMDKAFSGEYRRLERYFRTGYLRGIERTNGNNAIPGYGSLRNYAVSELAHRYGHWYLSRYALMRFLKDECPSVNLFLLEPEFALRLFPEGFSAEVETAADRFGVGAELLYSLILAESSFNHRFRSSAGAVGLLQIRPPTARDTARLLRIKQYSLYDPADSILLGGAYFSKLLSSRKGDVAAAAASYNAGPATVNKWLKKNRGYDTDILIDTVMYEETAGYVRAVQRNAFFYKLLH